MLLYLDNNSTTPLHPDVAAVMRDAWNAGYANPASQHRAGQFARRVLDDARDSIGRLLGAHVDSSHSDLVVFTSGGTEANNLAILGLAAQPPGRIIVSAIEHPSVLGSADELARRGFDVRRVRANSDGVVDLDHLSELLSSDTRLVSLMLANNETGVVQPVETAAELCRSQRIALHVDAAQAVGKMPVDFHTLGADTLTVAPHKFHGPVGIGALVIRAGLAIEPILWGGSQQGGIRPGTEGVPLVLGFQRALELWRAESAERPARMAAIRERFEAKLRQEWPELIVIGAASSRLPHVSSVAFLGVDRQPLLLALDLAGIACSTGSACASGSSEPSPVLRAMGLPDPVVDSALRFSFNCLQTLADGDEAAHRILKVLSDLRRNLRASKMTSPPRHGDDRPL